MAFPHLYRIMLFAVFSILSITFPRSQRALSAAIAFGEQSSGTRWEWHGHATSWHGAV